MVKLDLLVNGKPVDALSLIIHRDKAYQRGKALVVRMREGRGYAVHIGRLQPQIGSDVTSS